MTYKTNKNVLVCIKDKTQHIEFVLSTGIYYNNGMFSPMLGKHLLL